MIRSLTISMLVLVVFATTACKTREKKSMIVGNVIVEAATKKNGKPIEGSREFYLEYSEGRFFIKLSECPEAVVNRLKTGGAQPVVARVSIRNGSWDSDDPNVQSRVGDYCVIHSLHK